MSATIASVCLHGFARRTAIACAVVAVLASLGWTRPAQAQAPGAQLNLTKSGPSGTVQMGSRVPYVVVVRNGGSAPLTNVTVRDDMIGLAEQIASLGPGASAEFAREYPVTEADVPPDLDGTATHFSLTNTAQADCDQTDPVTASWTVNVEYWFNASRAELAIQMACPVSARAGEQVSVGLTVRNIGDVALANVHLASATLSLDEGLGNLTVGAAAERSTTYTVADADAPGPLVLQAKAWSDLAQPVTAQCEVAVLPSTVCERTDVTVILADTGPGTTVRAWVGGTEQASQTAALNAHGEPQASWTFYPPEGARWEVRVAADLPAGLDATRWAMVAEGEPAVTVGRCEQRVIVLRLEDRGAGSGGGAGVAAVPLLPQAAGAQPVAVLPQVGAWVDAPPGLPWLGLSAILLAWLTVARLADRRRSLR